MIVRWCRRCQMTNTEQPEGSTRTMKSSAASLATLMNAFHMAPSRNRNQRAQVSLTKASWMVGKWWAREKHLWTVKTEESIKIYVSLYKMHIIVMPLDSIVVILDGKQSWIILAESRSCGKAPHTFGLGNLKLRTDPWYWPTDRQTWQTRRLKML